jgi:hypothetical protein
VSSSGAPPAAPTGRIPPPVINTPWTVARGEYGFLTPSAIEFLQLFWSSIAGDGGAMDQIVQNYFSSSVNLAASGGAEQQQGAIPTDIPVASSIAALQADIESLRIRVEALSTPEIPVVSSSAVLWTPAIVGATTAGTQTYSAQYGFYGQIGPFILALFDVTLATLGGTAAGNCLITGLPIPCNTRWSEFGGWLGVATGMTLTSGYSWGSCYMQNGASAITVVQGGSNEPALALPVTSLSGTARLSGGVLYAI